MGCRETCGWGGGSRGVAPWLAKGLPKAGLAASIIYYYIDYFLWHSSSFTERGEHVIKIIHSISDSVEDTRGILSN